MSDGYSRVTLFPGTAGNEAFEHRVDLLAGPFQGSIEAVAYTNSYAQFRTELMRLYETLAGEAHLGGYENLDIRLRGDGLGHVQARVRAVADHYRGIELAFKIDLDQTQLPTILSSIERTFL